jgi:hypothetical protein
MEVAPDGAIFPPAAGGHPPNKEQTGPRISLQSAPGGNLTAGKYSGKSFAGIVSLDRSGAYYFYDCEFQTGLDVIYGGLGVTRSVTLEHCNILDAIWFVDGGQKDWTISWCYIQSDTGTVLRPHNTDTTTPTPFKVTDSIVEMTSVGSPSIHVTAMQDLGGCLMTFIRVKFIVPGPLIDGVTGQTAAITNRANDTLFDSCDFLSEKAYYYSVYVHGDNVLIRNCRFAHPLAGYSYPDNNANLVEFKGCIDLSTGEEILNFN